MRAKVAGACLTGKLRFADELEAKIALADLRVKRERQQMPEDRIEKRYYQCWRCRGGYHLTSKELNDNG